MARIETARDAATSAETRNGAGAARVVGLVNVHEKLREQVAESIKELDDLLAQLDEQAAS